MIENEKLKAKIIAVFVDKLDEFFDEEKNIYQFGVFDFKVKMRDGDVAKIEANILESILV